jgi:hypothetical protein
VKWLDMTVLRWFFPVECLKAELLTHPQGTAPERLVHVPFRLAAGPALDERS